MKRDGDKKRAAFLTLGCKANSYDTSALMGMASKDRFVVKKGHAGEFAEFYVINTCAVTGKSAFQSRQMVRRARRWNPDALVIATGCLAELEPESLLQAGADIAAGVSQRDRVVELLGGGCVDNGLFYHPEGGVQSRGRAVVKIQDGCDNRCAYCVVSIARGRSRSLPVESVLCQLRSLACRGFREAVLTGIHLGLYGRERGDSLAGLIRRIEGEADMPERIRLSSIEPQELDEELIEAMTSSTRVCPHLHLPLQSGDARVLELMRRPYTPDRFEEAVALIRSHIPNAGIGIDLIAGFPGETEAQHENTLERVSRLAVSYFHVFPFSKRPGTEAEKMSGHLDPALIKNRAKELRNIGREKKREFLAQQKGKTLEVLAETLEGARITGTSGNYLKVRFKGKAELIGAVVPVKITGRRGDILLGEQAPAQEHQH